MVKKVFTILGTAVGCIIAIAIVLNVILPNGIAGISNNVESAIKQATGATVDFNGDGSGKDASRTNGKTDTLEKTNLNGFHGEINGATGGK